LQKVICGVEVAKGIMVRVKVRVRVRDRVSPEVGGVYAQTLEL